MKSFVLASASPRRREILKKCGYNFVITPSDVEEVKGGNLLPKDVALTNARLKAEDVYKKTGAITLGADTVVVLDGKILGKPKDREENAEFLKRLSGRTHVVITAFCVIGEDGIVVSDYDEAKVIFNELNKEKISAYVESGFGADKAGGYGIQDGYGLVFAIDGEYDTVVGLPSKKVSEIIERFL